MCIRDRYKTLALTRKPDAVVEGAEMVVVDVTDQSSVEAALAGRKVRDAICMYILLLLLRTCLAARDLYDVASHIRTSQIY